MTASYLMILFFWIHISNLRALRDSVSLLNSIRISVVSFFLPKFRSMRPLSNREIAQFSRSINHQPLVHDMMIKEKVEKKSLVKNHYSVQRKMPYTDDFS
jgi:hypothetical protein